ncbi:MAG: UDP-N-acetylmuramyl-tripeptide synthetase [Patescibacteria group bacterium]
MRELLKKIIPTSLFRAGQPVYHYLLALAGAVRYGFPSRKLFVIGVTGTKGKSSVTEIVAAILEEAGYKTALSNTIRFKIAEHSEANMYKMSMPGLFFMQHFLARAHEAGCTHAVVEMTSEGAKQFRHKFIDLNAFVFTNLSPEHIESHGSYEKYRAAKLSIAKLIQTSRKAITYIVANADEPESAAFLAMSSKSSTEKIPYSLRDAEPYNLFQNGLEMTFRGGTDESGTKINAKLEGLFNIYNILAAATLASAMGIDTETIRRAVEKISVIKGRVEHVYAHGDMAAAQEAGQNFDVVVDYAHTADSLEKFYQAFDGRPKICILGNTGGGRDKWKRPVMAGIAEKYCDEVILTNEDPYDEDPQTILDEMSVAVSKEKLKIILDRRKAIHEAVQSAVKKSAKLPSEKSAAVKVAVLITGKGTDPYIMGANGAKMPWSDASVAREELEKVLTK